MVYSHEKKYIFIENSKAGSRSIQKILCDTASGMVAASAAKHAQPARIIKILGEDCWRKYFKFVFVRNPWDHFVSNWILLQTKNHPLHIPRGTTLKSYAFDYRKPGVDGYSVFFMHEGRLCVDYIGKLETIQEDYDTICSIINLPKVTMPHIESGFNRYKDYTVYYDDDEELIERVREIYVPEIVAYLGYEYGK